MSGIIKPGPVPRCDAFCNECAERSRPEGDQGPRVSIVANESGPFCTRFIVRTLFDMNFVEIVIVLLTQVDGPGKMR